MIFPTLGWHQCDFGVAPTRLWGDTNCNTMDFGAHQGAIETPTGRDPCVNGIEFDVRCGSHHCIPRSGPRETTRSGRIIFSFFTIGFSIATFGVPHLQRSGSATCNVQGLPLATLRVSYLQRSRSPTCNVRGLPLATLGVSIFSGGL